MKRKVVYIHPGLSSFVQKDIEILSSEFELNIHHFSLSSKFKLPLSFVKQFFFLLFNSINSKIWIVQFAGYQSFLPVLLGKLFRKKTVLVLGGTDCVGFPSIRYGCFYNKSLKPFTSYSLRNAFLLLPVDETLAEYNYTYQDNDFPKQGFKYHVKGIQTPHKVIYNGFELEKWQPGIKERNTFVTVAADLTTRFGIQLKGIDLILEIAKEFPDCIFYIVGGKTISAAIPENVVLTDKIPNNQLNDLLGSKEFYLQLSMSEGFPNALAEAMLCGCIPIVSNVGAMPKMIEGAGFLLTKKDLNELKILIQQAINHTDKAAKANSAREIIRTKYHLERRRNELIETIQSL